MSKQIEGNNNVARINSAPIETRRSKHCVETHQRRSCFTLGKRIPANMGAVAFITTDGGSASPPEGGVQPAKL